MRFGFTPETVPAARGGAAPAVGVAHENYGHQLDPLPENIRGRFLFVAPNVNWPGRRHQQRAGSMFPIHDTVPRRNPPPMVRSLIALDTAIFLFGFELPPPAQKWFLYRFHLAPVPRSSRPAGGQQ